MQGASIDGESFQKAYNEFRLARMAKLQQAMDIRSLECLACGDSPHAVHIDGNHKLFVWDRKQGQGLSQPTTGEELFFADEDVQHVVEYVDIATGSSGQVHHNCLLVKHCRPLMACKGLCTWLGLPTYTSVQVDARCGGLWRAATSAAAAVKGGSKLCTGRVVGESI